MSDSRLPWRMVEPGWWRAETYLARFEVILGIRQPQAYSVWVQPLGTPYPTILTIEPGRSRALNAAEAEWLRRRTEAANVQA